MSEAIVFLDIDDAIGLGWARTVYAVRACCVSCPACECLISNVRSDGSTSCHSCDWMPGQYPSNEAERVEFLRIVGRRFKGRSWQADDAGTVRRFLLGTEKKPEREIKFQCSTQFWELLNELVAIGLYGKSPAAVAEEFARIAAREETRGGR